MRALLRTRRWIGFTSIVVIVIVAFGLLSAWQFARAEERQRQAAEIRVSENADLTSPFEGAFASWHRVRVVGEFRPGTERAVRKRPLNGANGFWILTLLDTPKGSTWVNRGWIPATGAAEAAPDFPPLPQGSVVVTGVLRPFEDARPSDGLPDSVVGAVDRDSLGIRGSLDGYLQREVSDPPEPDLVPVPIPVIDAGRNISYAIQWIIFAAVAVVGWWAMLAREAKQEAQQTALDATEEATDQVSSSAN